MGVATPALERTDLQFYGSVPVQWVTIPNVAIRPAVEMPVRPLEKGSEIRAMYRELARQYDRRPRVPDYGGGLPGEINPA